MNKAILIYFTFLFGLACVGTLGAQQPTPAPHMTMCYSKTQTAMELATRRAAGFTYEEAQLQNEWDIKLYRFVAKENGVPPDPDGETELHELTKFVYEELGDDVIASKELRSDWFKQYWNACVQENAPASKNGNDLNRMFQ